MAEIWDYRISSTTAARLAGIQYTKLNYWLKTGVVPFAAPMPGSGYRRSFSFADILRIKAVVKLRAERVPLQTVRKAIEALTELWDIEDPLLWSSRMVIAGHEIFWALDDVVLLEVLTEQLASKPLVVVPLGEIKKELEGQWTEAVANGVFLFA